MIYFFLSEWRIEGDADGENELLHWPRGLRPLAWEIKIVTPLPPPPTPPPPRKKGNVKRKKVKRNRKMTGFPLAKFSQVCPFTRVQAKWTWLVLLANMFRSSKNHSESRSNKIHFPDIFTSIYIVISIKVYFHRNRIVLLSVCKIHKMWSMG